MNYALLHFLSFDTKSIDHLRKKYDPTADIIKPHITILFPVPSTVGERLLVKHIESVLKQWTPFSIRIRGFHKSWDHWLFLVVEEGNAEIVKLYKKIYTGILTPFRRDDIRFIPHIGLGLFVRNAAVYEFNDPKQLEFDYRKYKRALEEAKSLDLDFKCLVDKLHLVKLTDDFSHIEKSKEFLFG